jgi:hypothetical protein
MFEFLRAVRRGEGATGGRSGGGGRCFGGFGARLGYCARVSLCGVPPRRRYYRSKIACFGVSVAAGARAPSPGAPPAVTRMCA